MCCVSPLIAKQTSRSGPTWLDCLIYLSRCWVTGALLDAALNLFYVRWRRANIFFNFFFTKPDLVVCLLVQRTTTWKTWFLWMIAKQFRQIGAFHKVTHFHYIFLSNNGKVNLCQRWRKREHAPFVYKGVIERSDQRRLKVSAGDTSNLSYIYFAAPPRTTKLNLASHLVEIW